MSVTQEDMFDWKNHPVTLALIKGLRERIKDDSESLVMQSHGMHPQQMRDRALEIATIARFVADMEMMEVEDVAG